MPENSFKDFTKIKTKHNFFKRKVYFINFSLKL